MFYHGKLCKIPPPPTLRFFFSPRRTENVDLTVHFYARFDPRYGDVEASDVIDVLSKEISSPRHFLDVSIDPSSIVVKEKVEEVDKLALQTYAATIEVPQTTTTPRPPRKCSSIEFEYCRHLGYNATSYPNLVGHKDLDEVKDDIIAFRYEI